jgi:hypothetical protein
LGGGGFFFYSSSEEISSYGLGFFFGSFSCGGLESLSDKLPFFFLVVIGVETGFFLVSSSEELRSSPTFFFLIIFLDGPCFLTDSYSSSSEESF